MFCNNIYIASRYFSTKCGNVFFSVRICNVYLDRCLTGNRNECTKIAQIINRNTCMCAMNSYPKKLCTFKQPICNYLKHIKRLFPVTTHSFKSSNVTFNYIEQICVSNAKTNTKNNNYFHIVENMQAFVYHIHVMRPVPYFICQNILHVFNHQKNMLFFLALSKTTIYYTKSSGHSQIRLSS